MFMKKLWSWLKDNWLFASVCFLIVFIPLYPKIPLLDVVRTWVYVRLEDFMVGAVAGLYLLQLLWKRRFPDTALTWPILVYWFVGLVTVIAAIATVSKGADNFFPHLAILHYLRRIEYMVVFFLAYQAVREKRERLAAFIVIIGITLFLISIYGVGQKFAGWPAFLTMNEEFAKGVPLRLPPTARIAATFGGHYDLAAYLVLTIPILASLIFGLKKLWQKLGILFLTLIAYVLLLFTASRVSFGVYLVAITTMLVWQKKYLFIVPVIVVSFILLNLVGGAAERFYKTFRYSDVVVDLSTGQPIGTLDRFEGGSAYIRKSESPGKESLPTGSSFIGIPGRGNGNLTAVKTIELFKNTDLATGSGDVATISGSFLIQKALVYDISITTRFQAQWPRAIDAFKRNVLVGSGFSYLSLAADGDYHRMLGETGLLGTVAFLGIFAYAIYLFVQTRDKLKGLEKAFVIGVFAGLVGLLLNALLIDVFEASKVAFTLWMLLGLALGVMKKQVAAQSLLSYINFLRRMFVHPVSLTLYLVLGVFLLFGNSITHYFIGDDFTWLRWAAETRMSDLVNYFTDAGGFFYRPIPKLVYFALFSIFWLKPAGYHLVMLFIYAGSVVLLYGIQRHLKITRMMAWMWTLVYLSLSIHHENVFWISGLSGLLGSVFTLLGIYLWLMGRRAAGTVAAGLAMLSHDSMLVAPIFLLFTEWGSEKKFRKSSFWVMMLPPLYWWVRSAAGAYIPEGDYGVNLQKFPVNALANIFGYITAIPIGPTMVANIQNMRIQLKQFVWQFFVVGGVITVIISIVFIKMKGFVRLNKMPMAWAGCFLVSLAAFLGLGGIAERNALVASGFWILGLAGLSKSIWETGSRQQRFILMTACGLLFFWNVGEVRRVSNDWQTAGRITEQSLLSIKSAFFPVERPVTFAFVNVPIRFGSAWVFPTGLPDALWLMFREAPFLVRQYSTVQEGFIATEGIGRDRQVLVFEDFVLKKAVKDEVIVEAD